jgi:hypothetical protein
MNKDLIVNGNYICKMNEITSLEGSPIRVTKDFDCSHNELISLDGAPEYVGGDFNCFNNPNITKKEIIEYKKSGAVKGIIISNYGKF